MFSWSIPPHGVAGLLVVSLLVLAACSPLAETPAPLPPPAMTDLTHGEPPDYLYVTAHDDLLLRAAPNFNAEITGAMRYGTTAHVVRTDSGLSWLQVNCAGKSECWLHNGEPYAELVDAGQLTAGRLVPQRSDEPMRLDVQVQDATVVKATATVMNMDHYLVSAGAGEQLTVELSSDNGAYFAVTGVTEAAPYKKLADPALAWTARLSTNQDYLISVATAAPGTTYELYVGRAKPHSTTILPPARVQFPASTGSHKLTGRLVSGLDNRYALAAPAGGRLSVHLTSREHQADFAVLGATDGRTYKRMNDDVAAWSGIVPTAQDYIIVVSNGLSAESDMIYTVDLSLQ